MLVACNGDEHTCRAALVPADVKFIFGRPSTTCGSPSLIKSECQGAGGVLVLNKDGTAKKALFHHLTIKGTSADPR